MLQIGDGRWAIADSCYFGGFEPPLSRVLPPGKVTDRPFATGPPNLARKPVTTTSRPAGTVSRFHPSRNSALGAPSSKRQLVTLPSGSVTSTYSHECGLTRSSFVTLPVTFTGLSTSNSAAKA